MNNEDLTNLLIDAIMGKGFFSDHYANLMEERGLAEFTGNQHNPEWEWIPRELKKLPTDELEKIYAATEKDFPSPPADDNFVKVTVREGALANKILAEIVFTDPVVHAAAAAGMEALIREDKDLMGETLRDRINRQCEEEVSKDADRMFFERCKEALKEPT